jgi:hypothetical protein
MGLAPWITCLWPGLPRLWWRGQASGLFTAAFFAIWLNATVLDAALSPIFTNPGGRWANWAVLAGFWLVSFRRAARNLTQIYCGDAHYNDELFARAQTEYLRGQWFEAESLLLRLLREEPSDVEGRLLLATLYRHTRRPDLARAQLDRLERLPQGSRWRWEILQERTLAERVASILATESPEQALVPAEPDSSDLVTEEKSAPDEESGGLSKVA